jgi:hypothetical protein
VKYKTARSRIQAKTITSDVKAVPRYSDLTIVRRNILTADGEKLRFIPFLENDEDPTGKNGKRLQKELQSAYKSANTELNQDREQRNLLLFSLDWWLDTLPMPCTVRILEQYLVKEDKLLGESFRNCLLKSLGGNLTPAVHKMASRFTEAFDTVFGFPLRDVLLSNNRLMELSKLVGKSSRKSIDTNTIHNPLYPLETYINLTCQICSAIDCQSHGEFTWERPPDFGEEGQRLQADNTNYLTVPQRLTMQPAELLRKYNERLAREEEESNYDESTPKMCSLGCTYSSHPRAARSGEPEISQADEERIHLLLITIRNKQRRSCTIASALGLTCWKVYWVIEEYEKEGGPDLQYDQSPVPTTGRAKRPEWYDNKKKTLKGDWQKVTSAHAHEAMGQANPVSCLSIQLKFD